MFLMYFVAIGEILVHFLYILYRAREADTENNF